MASLHKRPRSENYYAAFTGPDGRRVLKSTGFDDHNKAWKRALEWQDAARAARAKQFTANQAWKILSECVTVSTGETLSSFTCSEWFEDWLKNKKGSTAPKTYEKYSSDIGSFLDAIGTRKELPLRVISSTDVRSWRDARRKSGLSVTTCNLALKVVRGAFQRAVALGYIDTNPCAPIDPLKDDQHGTREVFTPEQVNRLIAAASPDWSGVILMGFFTGLRLRDITELRWQSIDLKAAMLCVLTKKTGTTVEIPLHTNLLAWLKSRPPAPPSTPIFPTLKGKSGAGKSGLSSQFKRIMESVNISGKSLRVTKGAGRSQSSLSFHSLRHSFVSALANAGVAADIRQKLAGHSDSKSHARYSHHEVATMKAAVDLIPGLLPLAQ